MRVRVCLFCHNIFMTSHECGCAGEKFYYLKNEGALLELALINWAVQKLVAKGWTPVLTPDLIRFVLMLKKKTQDV